MADPSGCSLNTLASRQWAVHSVPSTNGDSVDYGIISRVINPTTGGG
jgi:hypothetical protein